MADLFPKSEAALQRDIDDLQLKVDGMAESVVATILSYDAFSESGVAKTAAGQSIQFVNWSGATLFENTQVFILTKDTKNYVVATQETVSGWASTQSVIKRPAVYAGSLAAFTLKKSDVGKLVLVTETTGEVQVAISRNVAFVPGQSVDFVRAGAAEVRFLAATTDPVPVTVVATPGFRLRAQWSVATVICIEPNKYLVVGDLKS
jgi:hypothetical protein